ncbi:MAG: hypothetical protein WEB13_05615 [Dehalococcoidia bacterium]
MRLRGLAFTAGSALLMMAAAACDGAEPGSAVDDDSSFTPIASATATPPPPSPSAVIQCGTEEQVHGTGRNLDARRCLLDAYERGSAATFTSQRSTIEGDPIVWTVNVLAPGRIEATIDNTADKFSAPSDRVVRTYRCGALILSDVEPPLTIELSGCDGDTGGTIAI